MKPGARARVQVDGTVSPSGNCVNFGDGQWIAIERAYSVDVLPEPPYYVNHGTTEPRKYDVAVDADSGAAPYVYIDPWWMTAAGATFVRYDLPERLRLLVRDGAVVT